MEITEMAEAVRIGVAAALEGVSVSRRMMAMAAFAAVDEDGRPLRVVGVAEDDGDALQFVCVRDDPADDEIWPVMVSSVWRAVPH